MGATQVVSGPFRNWRTAWLVVAAATVLSSPGLATRPAVDASVALQAPASCSYGGPSTLFVPLASQIGGILIDPACEYVYVSNMTQNRIEVYSLDDQSFETPIPVGAMPRGMDFTPDGALLYVANSGEHTVSVVDVSTRTELRKISIPFDSFQNDRPVWIAIGNNGVALLNTQTGSGGRMMELRLATDVASLRTDFGPQGGNAFQGRLKASGDRSSISVVNTRDSGGNVYVYDAATDEFEEDRRLQVSLDDVAVNRTGSTVVAVGLAVGFVVDPSTVVGVTAGQGGRGYAVHPTLGLGYRPVSDRIDIMNLTTFLKIGERPLGDNIVADGLFNDRGRIDASDDGTLVAVITSAGFSIVKPFPFAPEKITLVGNGDFAADLTAWQIEGSGAVTGTVIGGAFQFNRVAPSPAPAVLQIIEQPFPAGAPIDIRVGLGNSGSGPRTIRVRMADGVGDDAHICTFVIPGQTSLSTYRMRVVTSGGWADATIDVDADPASGDGGFALVDNVSVLYDGALTGGDECVTPPPPPPAGNCQLSQPTPYAVPITGTFHGVLIDDTCRYVYMLTRDLNRVDVFSLQTLTFEEPIQAGSLPSGFDITPDGSTMYVANGGGHNVSQIDLRQRVEVRRIPLAPSLFLGFVQNVMARSVAIASNGKALVTTSLWCCSSEDDTQELVLATGVMSPRLDEPSGVLGIVRASGDRHIIGFGGPNNTSGQVNIYSAAADTFATPVHTNVLNVPFVDFTVNGDGSRLFVVSGNILVDSTPAVLGTVSLSGFSRAAALHPTLPLGYRPFGSAVDVLNLDTLTQVGSLPLGGTTNTAPGGQPPGQVDISSNGRLLAVRTTTGYSLVDPFAAGPPQNFNVVRNGSFANGTTAWTTFATPDLSYMESQVTNGVFEFNRLPAPPGTQNQAVVFQHTGIPLPSGAPVQAQFDLGNSSSARKRISVLLLDSNFSDLHVCTFWIPPNSPLATYRMRSHTTRPWNDAAIYFYAATAGSDGGYNRLDNVSLQFNSTLPNDRTACEDPNAPAPGVDDGPDLIVNGDFGAPALAPWATFGTLTSQVAGGVFEFVRPTSTPPAGVILQPTGQSVGAAEILTATFELGNSSAVRKRVTVLLHDNDFTDLSACTFWLPPGQPLSPYSMSMYATEAWSDATISVYGATVGPDQWTRLDNVTLRKTQSVDVSGTDCVEPPGASPGQAAVATGSAGPAGRSGALVPSERHVAGVSERIDLTHAAAAMLTLNARVLSEDLAGEIEVSVDGGEWRSLLTVTASEDWVAIDLDLSPWLGRTIALRFVTHDAARPPVWQIRGFRVAIQFRQ